MCYGVQVSSWASHVAKLSGFAARQAVHFCAHVIGGGVVGPTSSLTQPVSLRLHRSSIPWVVAWSAQLAASSVHLITAEAVLFGGVSPKLPTTQVASFSEHAVTSAGVAAAAMQLLSVV